MKFRFSKYAAAAALVLLSPLAGCPGHIDDVTGTGGTGGTVVQCTPQGGATTPPATFATVRMALMGGGSVASCASAPCHGANGMAPPPPAMHLTLQDDADLYRNMTTYTSHACGDMPLVNKGKPQESALVKILNEACGVTPRMPYGCYGEFCQPPDVVAAISQWIANCAPEQ